MILIPCYVNLVVLVEEDVPSGAIAVLGKGFGYVPSPQNDVGEERLHMRQTVNRIMNESKKRCREEANITDYEQVPAQLRQASYNLSTPAPDKQVNTIVERLVTAHDASLATKKSGKNLRSNLSKEELNGLKWLKEKTDKDKLSVVQADKGGAILIVTPDLIKKKVLEKLEDPLLYTKLDQDPLKELKKELFEFWKFGKLRKFVSEKMAYEIGGVTENNNMSTHPRFKPGVPYVYPMLKIHKLRKEDLIPGVEPPVRLVTSLQDEVSKRKSS